METENIRRAPSQAGGTIKCLRLVKFEEYGELRMSYISVEHGIMSTLDRK